MQSVCWYWTGNVPATYCFQMQPCYNSKDPYLWICVGRKSTKRGIWVRFIIWTWKPHMMKLMQPAKQAERAESTVKRVKKKMNLCGQSPSSWYGSRIVVFTTGCACSDLCAVRAAEASLASMVPYLTAGWQTSFLCSLSRSSLLVPLFHLLRQFMWSFLLLQTQDKWHYFTLLHSQPDCLQPNV